MLPGRGNHPARPPRRRAALPLTLVAIALEHRGDGALDVDLAYHMLGKIADLESGSGKLQPGTALMAPAGTTPKLSLLPAGWQRFS
jgi:hypothetical protein